MTNEEVDRAMILASEHAEDRCKLKGAYRGVWKRGFVAGFLAQHGDDEDITRPARIANPYTREGHSVPWHDAFDAGYYAGDEAFGELQEAP